MHALPLRFYCLAFKLAKFARGWKKWYNIRYMSTEHDHEQHEVGYFEVSAEHCSAKLTKGASAEKIPSHMLVMDTGQPWVPETDKREPKTQEELDALYRETIGRGIIDHHGIDSAVLNLPQGVERKCATKMVADFAPEVLAVIKKRNVSSVTAHIDSDLDSIASTYLAKALVQSGDAAKMPKITKQLGDFVNLTDYGKYRESDPQKYANSLQGVFSSIKSALMNKQRAEMGAMWGDASKTPEVKRREAGEISARYSQEVVERSIEVLNACERASVGSTIDLAALDTQALVLSEKTRMLLETGTKLTIEDFKKFNKEFEKAEKTTARVITKEGKEIEVPLLIFNQPDLNPLAVTNMAYQRVAPEAIVVVFAGGERKYGGDMYDVGIKPETADLFDLKALEMPLNEAEEQMRQGLFGDLEAMVAEGRSPTIEQQAALDRWKMKPQDLLAKWKALRPGFEHTGHGDPTVVVAGGSLLAASTTSLMNAEEFRRVLGRVLEGK